MYINMSFECCSSKWLDDNSLLMIFTRIISVTSVPHTGDGDHTSVDAHFGMASLAIIQRKGHTEMTNAAGISLEHVVHP